MSHAAYTLDLPQKRSTSVVFASPHSGRNYSDTFLAQTVLDKKTIRSSEDAFVDKLFVTTPRFGAPFLQAGAPRAFIDLNRSAEELDPALIDGIGKTSHNPRIASGLGVIPRVVANGRAIYRGKIPLKDAQDRLVQFWHPYHTRLQRLLDESHRKFGEAILIDCHSMPHEAIASIEKTAVRTPHIVLGDRFGAAADPRIMDAVEHALVKAGLNVVRNTPFAGAYIAQRYGRPSQQQHVVQIEIDRSLYMDEKTILPRRGFESFRRIITKAIADIAQIGQTKLPMAAE